jgi:phenylpropionate dioxygenase-like ring-hydroxylating dioxygenase large terminal subunit
VYPVKGNYYHLNARYMLLTENLLDLSHLSFIHAGSIGSPEIAKTPVEVGTGDSDLRVARNVRNAEMPQAFQDMLKCPPRADRLNTTDYFPPTLFSDGSAIYESGTNNLYGAWCVIHCATPETAHSTHYFWGFTRNFAPGDDTVTQIFLDVNKRVFAEDIRALEALEASLSSNAASRDDRSAAADAGALRGRHILEEMIEKEEAAVQSLQSERAAIAASR